MKRSLLLACICLFASPVSAKGPTEKATMSASRIAFSVGASVDLTPYKPSGWSDKIVVSNGTGTNTDSGSLAPADTLYVDWAVSNNGGAATAARFYTELYVDGVLRFTWYSDPPLSPNYHISVEDYSIGSLSAGTHTIRIKADSANAVAESDETNNEYTKTITVGSGGGLCMADSRTLCLSGGRFQVQVGFQTSTIPAGVSTAVPLSGDTGYFWFFSSGNVELVVKILDGRPLNNYFWIFYGALSNVAYTITVTDTTTGAVKTYSNPAGRLASVADTAAFGGSLGSAHFMTELIGEAEAPVSRRMSVASGRSSADLTPYKPSGWSDKIVVSDGTGTNTDSGSLAPADTLYVDWAVSNNGGAGAAPFATRLYVDGVLSKSWSTDRLLDPNYYVFVEDYSIGSLSAGTHTIRIKADSANAVAESDETNNEYTKTITVGSGGSLCMADSRTLCLSGGRFQVQVGFQTSTIPAGVGTAVPLSGDTGYFWFFSSGNVELVVKILDGRPFNNYFWIFYGALSNVAYTITVTDTTTGAVKTYSNPAGRLASVADTSAFPPASGIPIAHLEIDHSSIGDLAVTLGAGDPANPSCLIPVANRAGGTNANLVRDVDLTPCASSLPPSTNTKWFLQVQDASSGKTGQIRVFRITTGGQSFAATDVPAPIQDLQTSWSFIPSGGSPPPPPPPGGNHAPTLSRVDATRISHSFGRDDSYRSEGVANRPGFAALQPLTAPRVITLDDNHDGQPDSTSPIVVAAAGLSSCCTLLVAGGFADPDGDALVFHWQAVAGTFYSTGTDASGGFAFGQKITNVAVYNRNSVFFELPSIGNVILAHDLMGGLTNPGASVTDVRSVPSQSLSSPARFAALEWGRGVHLEVALLDSKGIDGSDPKFPGGIEMTLFANVVGNFLVSTLPTFRVETDHADGTRTVIDQDSSNNGGRIKLQFKHSEIGSQAAISIVASTPGTPSGGNPFVFVPASPGISVLDLWRSRGCTVGDHAVMKVEFQTGPKSIDVWDSGSAADDAFDLVVDGATLGRTPPGGDRLFTNLSLSSGTHHLCVVYVDCSSCEGKGTYSVRLNGDMTFAGGATEKTGFLDPDGTKPKAPYVQDCYDFSVPFVDR